MFSDDSAWVGTYDTFYGYGTVGTVGTVGDDSAWVGTYDTFHRTHRTVPPYPTYRTLHRTIIFEDRTPPSWN